MKKNQICFLSGMQTPLNGHKNLIMNLESSKITVSKSVENVYDFLSDVKNFETLMPDNISKFELLDDDKFIFALSGMEIVLQKDENPPNSIMLGAAGGKLDFSLQANISVVNDNESEVQLNFNGDFNPMAD